MNVPNKLNELVEQIRNELNDLDTEISQTLQVIRARINLFPDNIVLIQLFATINNYTLFATNTRTRLEETFKYLTNNPSLSEDDIIKSGEDLSEQLGRILEAKIIINQIKNRL